MKSNLHLHSKFSDGTMWPEEVAARAAQYGLEQVALTDHDSMEGIPAFLGACSAAGLRGVPGVEVDTEIRNRPDLGYNSEILGYFPHGPFSHFQAFLREKLAARRSKMEQYLEAARNVFDRPDLDLAGLLTHKIGFWNEYFEAIEFSLMKPDLLVYLQAQQVLPADFSLPQFKSQFFPKKSGAGDAEPETTGILGFADADKPDLREIAQLIQADGGYAVLPHPGHWCRGNPGSPRDLQSLLEFCSEIGVWGVELYYYMDPSEDVNALVKDLGQQMGLHLTFGTDCHGRGSHQDTLERAWMDLEFLEWSPGDPMK